MQNVLSDPPSGFLINSIKKLGMLASAIIFLVLIGFCIYAIGDFFLGRTIGRCNGGPTQQTCTEAQDVNVCTCDHGYHYFWQADPGIPKK